MCSSRDVVRHDDGRLGSILEIALSSALDTGSAEPKTVENSVMMAFRAVANCFVTEDGRALAASQADQVLSVMECVTATAEPPVGGVKGPIGANNRNVLIALASAAINYGVLACTEQKARGSKGVGEEALARLMHVLEKILTSQTDSEVVFRALVALGNLISIPGDGNYACTAKSMGAEAWVKTAQSKAGEERVRNLAGAVLRSLR